MSIPPELNVPRLTRILSGNFWAATFGELITFTGIGTSYANTAYSPFISTNGQTGAVVALYITNTGSSAIYLSFDGIVDNLYIPVSSQTNIYDLLNNRRGLNSREVWARSATAGGSVVIAFLI